MSAKASKDMANILRDVILHGTARSALRLGRSDIAGKTGTTNDAKDAWFAGFSPKLVAVSWVGFDQPASLGRLEYGGYAALPLWNSFMNYALADIPEQWIDGSRPQAKTQSTEKPTNNTPTTETTPTTEENTTSEATTPTADDLF
jgi:penicillin-binding protein 1A